MDKNSSRSDLGSSEVKESVEPKVYTKPVLTQYGEISTLVLAMGGMGTDGFPVPSLSLT